MKVPLLLSKFYTNTDLSHDDVAELVEVIGAQLGAVEAVEDFGAKFAGALVVRVVSCEKHANSDHLNVCKIDDGGKAEGLARDENGFVQVVCGAPNVRSGLTVVWLPPGATVPESYGKDPFVLGSRELRGVISNGMLASQRELALGDSHEGILEIDEDIAPGTPFADACNLNDHIIDIENKMFTHRPDCFGLLGVYREIAGIRGQKFVSPAWYGGHKYDLAVEADILPLHVTNELPEMVPRFMAVPMSNITVGPSPLWLQIHLARVGIRAINNIVDITNYVMYLTGQPLHAYDYDKVAALTSGEGAELTVRYPRQAETITLLSGKQIEPRSEAVMIASGNHLIGVGGVMGGADTEVDASTQNIILEVATFDMYSIRRTAMAHGLFTDAVARFNKGQSPLQNPSVIAKAIHEVRMLAGGKTAGEIVDVSQVGDRAWVHPPVSVTAGFINMRLGFALDVHDMRQLLENVEFVVVVEGDTLTVTAPFWRTDIETREDVVEEIGRLYGFDKLPLELPQRSLAPVAKDSQLELKAQVRSLLAKAGANEVLTYSFVHGDLLQRAGQDPAAAYKIGNALSPDLQYYRLSLTPSLLDKIHLNVKAGYDNFALFELGKAHLLGKIDDAELPVEFDRLALVCAGRKQMGAAYFQAQTYLQYVLSELGVSQGITYAPLQSDEADVATRYYEPGRAATVLIDGVAVGRIGEYKSSVRKGFKLPDFCAGFELGLEPLLSLKRDGVYESLPRFPKVTQDITLKVPAELPSGELDAFMQTHLVSLRAQGYYAHIVLTDIYQGDDIAVKNNTYRLVIANHDRTMTDTEVAKMLDGIAAAALKTFSAERV
jgi:phenylalanyl-tRNA synthetase beta chain